VSGTPGGFRRQKRIKDPEGPGSFTRNGRLSMVPFHRGAYDQAIILLLRCDLGRSAAATPNASSSPRHLRKRRCTPVSGMSRCRRRTNVLRPVRAARPTDAFFAPPTPSRTDGAFDPGRFQALAKPVLTVSATISRATSRSSRRSSFGSAPG